MTESFAPWQSRVFEQAQMAFSADRLGHGLLFCGPSGLGKSRVARRLAEFILAESGTNSENVRARQLLAAGTHPDVHMISFAPTRDGSKLRSEIVIEQIRDLSQRLALTPQYGVAQIAIIDPADALNTASCNALLKTLEEPVPGRYLWLVTARPDRLPATIRSRCQRLDFKLPRYAEALTWLVEDRSYAPEVATEALDSARGHPGLADEWLSGHGWALRREVIEDLIRLRSGKADPVEISRRWSDDDLTLMRLSYAADWVAEQGMDQDNLTNPGRLRKLTAWFGAINRTRELLRSTVREDLAVLELLSAWRESAL